MAMWTSLELIGGTMKHLSQILHNMRNKSKSMNESNSQLPVTTVNIKDIAQYLWRTDYFYFFYTERLPQSKNK